MEKAYKKELAGTSEIGKLADIIEQIESKPENLSINPRDFNGVSFFTQDEIERDLYLVEEKRNKIQKNQDKSEEMTNALITANFVEAMVPEAIRSLEWLGNKVRVIKPSLYDDYYRGIDNVLQILPEDVIENEKWIRCIGFSMDFTISKEDAEKKAFDLMIALTKGVVPSMKYFKTDVVTTHGPMEIKLKNFKLPRIIMFCPKEIMNESKEQLLNYQTNTDSTDARETAKDCDLKYHFIRESISQLEFFAKLSGIVGNDTAQKVYSDSLISFRQILLEQGITDEIVSNRAGKYPGLIGKSFDINANGGQLIKMLKALSTQTER